MTRNSFLFWLVILPERSTTRGDEAGSTCFSLPFFERPSTLGYCGQRCAPESRCKSLVPQRDHWIDARCSVRRRVGTQERGAEQNYRSDQQGGWIVTLDSV